MRKTTKFFINIAVLLILIIPAISLAQEDSRLVTCTEDCDWTDLMNLVNTIINFILYKMAIPIAAIMFAYAGFKMVTAGGEAAHARTEAKEIFTNTVIGLVLAAAAWLIIKTILSILGYQGAWIGF
ncbi:MAG: hypothetical protein WA060_01820 [Minisyncoccia bacterium]